MKIKIYVMKSDLMRFIKKTSPILWAHSTQDETYDTEMEISLKEFDIALNGNALIVINKPQVI